MTTQTIRILIAGALLVHGIGHSLGFWKPAKTFPLVHLSEAQIRLFAGIIWSLVALGFIASAMGFWGSGFRQAGGDHWRSFLLLSPWLVWFCLVATGQCSTSLGPQ